MNLTFLCVLIILSFYFIYYEAKQMVDDIFEYITDLWNFIDLLPPLIIVTLLFVEMFLKDKESFYKNEIVACIFSFSSFLMWIKLIYFLRLYKTFAYLIHMIVRVIVDMGPFIVIFVITLCAFAEAFLIISEFNIEDPETEE